MVLSLTIFDSFREANLDTMTMAAVEDTSEVRNKMFMVRDAFKKKTPYGGTLSQPGGEGVKITFKMSLLKIPFY